jgi:hypothetical protein
MLYNPTRGGGFINSERYLHLHKDGLRTQWVVDSSFSLSVIRGGFGTRGTQRLKLWYEKDSFLLYKNKRNYRFPISGSSIDWKKVHRPSFCKISSSFNHIDKRVLKIEIIELKRKNWYSQYYNNNNSKHEWSSSDI